MKSVEHRQESGKTSLIFIPIITASKIFKFMLEINLYHINTSIKIFKDSKWRVLV